MTTISRDRQDTEEDQVFKNLERQMKRQIYPLKIKYRFYYES